MNSMLAQVEIGKNGEQKNKILQTHLPIKFKYGLLPVNQQITQRLLEGFAS